jgi:hypothetical protein
MFTHSPLAHATTPPFTKSFVRYDVLKQSAVTTGRVCFQPSIATNMINIAVTFPTNSATNYVLGAAAAWAINTSNLDTGQTAVPAPQITSEVTTVVGQTVTFTWGSSWTAPSTSNLWCFNWTNATGNSLTLPNNSTETAAGTITSNAAGPTPIDTTNFSYSSALISNNAVVISATVPPQFQLILSGNTDTFGNLAIGSINLSTTPRTLTATTNAATGFILWAEDSGSDFKTVTDAGSNPANEHGGLKSATANYVISNNTASSLGTPSHLFVASSDDYGLSVTNTTQGTGAGTTTINAAYINTGGTNNHAGVLNPTFFEPIASDGGTAAGNVITVDEIATIGANTPAASDYTDTISYTGAGSF